MNESDRQELMELIEFLQQGAKHPFISTVVMMQILKFLNLLLEVDYRLKGDWKNVRSMREAKP